MAARRWSRSAGTASASISRTVSTRPGMTSSIRTASAAGWSRSMSALEACSWTPGSSSSPTACARTRSASRAATLRLIRTATPEREIAMTWTAMLALGAYHGINPGMGWLFAVALGMQQGSARGVCRALPPIALGHAAAVAAVLAAAATVGIVVPMPVLKVVVAATLVVLGCYRLWSHRHPRFGGMQVGFRDLTVWSFLMASAHGAGFMLLPWVMAMPADVSLAPGGHAGHVMTMSAGDAGTAWAGLLAVGVHTAAYLLVMTLAAWIVYRKIGLAFLRTAWFNLDWLWAGALVITGVVMVAPLLSTVAFSQSADSTSAFALADVHVSPRSTTSAMRVSSRAGRYEIRNATMVDLIRTAYTVDAENVLGGPSWLEYDRFDVVALVPPNTSPDTQKLMLRTLLADRFKLAVRRETKPAAGLVLVAGKGKHKLKEAADSAAAPGCQSQAVPAARPSGVPGQFVLPMTGLACHNVTMETFASDLKRLSNGYVTNAVVDQTGLKGSWDFELKFTQRALLGIAAQMDGASATSLSDAIDKQLGLKLEERDIPTPALIVEQVNAKPTTNSLDVATKLPPPPPMEFEVADIKPVDPNVRRTGPIQLGVLPGGRVNLPGLPLKLVITLAWGLPTNQNDQLIGAPKWLDSA